MREDERERDREGKYVGESRQSKKKEISVQVRKWTRVCNKSSLGVNEFVAREIKF